jgi:regulator of RNase E activity RraA
MAGTIQSVTPILGPTVGIAFTCEIDSSTPGGAPDLEGYWSQLDAMGRTGLPSVWVIKAVGSRPEHECVFGDGMAKTLHAVGCGGVVTDGRVRDVEGLLSTPFAAYCRGKTIHHCAVRVRSTDRPVEVGGIVVRPGDVIHANAEGVIKIPAGCLDALSGAAARMRAFEHEVHAAWRRTDLTVSDKRARVAELLASYGFERPPA